MPLLFVRYQFLFYFSRQMIETECDAGKFVSNVSHYSHLMNAWNEYANLSFFIAHGYEADWKGMSILFLRLFVLDLHRNTKLI